MILLPIDGLLLDPFLQRRYCYYWLAIRKEMSDSFGLD